MTHENKKMAIKTITNWLKKEIDDCYKRELVNIYLDKIGANKHTVGGSATTLVLKRKALLELMIDRVYELSRDESPQAEKTLMEIAAKCDL